MIQETSKFFSIIISTLNEGDELLNTVKSIFNSSIVPYEVIVIDDGSNDRSCDALQNVEWCSRNVVVYKTQRLGIAEARNFGSTLSKGKFLLFLDAHCRLESECIRKLENALIFKKNSIIAPAICDFNSEIFGCGARLIDADLRYQWLLPSNATNNNHYHIPIVPGGCFALSRNTFNILGGFCNFQELGLEDVEISLRAWRIGIDIIALPFAKLAHKFRKYPPYLLNSTSRNFNLARLALIHFEGYRRDECLRRIIGTHRAAEVLVDAFNSDWENQKKMIISMSKRDIDEFFVKFGDWM